MKSRFETPKFSRAPEGGQKILTICTVVLKLSGLVDKTELSDCNMINMIDENLLNTGTQNNHLITTLRHIIQKSQDSLSRGVYLQRGVYLLGHPLICEYPSLGFHEGLWKPELWCCLLNSVSKFNALPTVFGEPKLEY